MADFRLAVSFLTFLPLYGKRVATEKEMARSLYYYSLAGFVVGGILLLVSYINNKFQLGLAGDALILVVWMLVTGGLHMDGLMDTADGIFSGRDLPRKLEIMKDSRVGAMGVIALASVVLLKLTFLNILPYPLKYWALLSAPALGRAMMVFPIVFFPYARLSPGLGKAFGSNVSKYTFAVTLLLALMGGTVTGGIIIFVALLVAAVLSVILARHIAAILGGHTGDTFGAICEITEALFLIVVAILFRVY